MKKILIVILLTIGLITSTVYANDKFAKVDVMGNAMIIQEGKEEYIIPIFNMVSIYMDRKKKMYYVKYYGYYRETTRNASIDKETYERLKRVLIKTEQ